MLNRIIIPLIILLFIPGLSFPQEKSELSLSDAISIALENNYGVVISKADAGIAGINNNWANAGRYPNLSFDLSSSNNQDLSDNTYSGRLNADLGVNWTIFNGFKVNLTKEKLGGLENLAKGRSAVIVENTISDVIMAYYQVLLNEKRLEVLEKVMNLSLDRLRYEEARQEYGSSVTYNVLQSKNNYLSDKAAFLEQEALCRSSVRNLNFLMGTDSNVMWLFIGSFEAETEDFVLSDLLDKMITGNTSLKNQYVNILLAENNTKLTESNYYPSLRLSAGLDNTNIYSPETLRGNSFSAYANVALSIDIYQAGQRKRAVEIARIEESIAGLEEEEMKRSLSNQLYNLYDDYSLRKELLGVSAENLEAAALNMNIAGEKYRSGAINSFNYRDIQLIYLDAAYRELQAVYNLIASKTSLTRITGGFISEEKEK